MAPNGAGSILRGSMEHYREPGHNAVVLGLLQRLAHLSGEVVIVDGAGRVRLEPKRDGGDNDSTHQRGPRGAPAHGRRGRLRQAGTA